ncbi:hypothetical protein AB4Z38_07145 [Arthrobacter sp. 2RAF6]|uniref:hypothetical protein n=1 Tax=Arthrobacter sp. 2RAF6 TaxID=3233002 RepID=UPI003F92AEFF
MPQTRPNVIQVPVNADGYNLTADLATMADSANVVIPVPNQTARDALTLHTGLTVTRNDVPGQPIEIYNGSSWDRIGPRAHANSQIVGSGMTANDYLTGTKRLWTQGGTTVGTTDAAGNVAVSFPVAFPNGLESAVVCNGDSTTGNLLMSVSGSLTSTLSTLFVNVRIANTGAFPATSSAVRINWSARGW